MNSAMRYSVGVFLAVAVILHPDVSNGDEETTGMSAQRKASGVMPLPGQRGRRSGMRTYLVMPTDAALQRPASVKGRKQIVSHNLAVSSRLAASIVELARSMKAEAHVDGVPQVMTLGSVMVTCTPELAKAIAGIPEAGDIIDDTPDMQLN